MQNKVRWQREEGGTCVPYMFEEVNKRWVWVRYSNSKCKTNKKHPLKDISAGYMEWQEALRRGYVVEDRKD